eukprot:CAMPEP_0185600582 /NCGR_PEP_ID=MMETSP0436-20130131/520_1 /TAXON_ID=626734 ORGANISM="Favella taraikaensis, Strain Fe Narragansett Bay" /NCGR_SAMPLE_ID=MMETSP0436 /ASSEMBLY_ACC=CAM_ASM_000390 /LENGTH=157 /DNA_ID=CAMNT_0028230325 /DNA_START=192 /DNA_END=665 /DNA_ORIENTATION=-
MTVTVTAVATVAAVTATFSATCEPTRGSFHYGCRQASDDVAAVREAALRGIDARAEALAHGLYSASHFLTGDLGVIDEAISISTSLAFALDLGHGVGRIELLVSVLLRHRVDLRVFNLPFDLSFHIGIKKGVFISRVGCTRCDGQGGCENCDSHLGN